MKALWAAMCVLVGALACGGTLVDNGDGSNGSGINTTLHQQSIDKVDLLLAIDNSASMGDKQQLFSLAIPVLLSRLLNPNCVSSDASLACKQAADCTAALGASAQCDTTFNGGNGQCWVPGDNQGVNQCKAINGTKPEFLPVHDLHVGIVTSSLGGGGSPDICVPGQTDVTHQDDHGYLINRTYNPMTNTEGPGITNAKPVDGIGGNFLAWLPTDFPQNMGKPQPNVTPYTTATQMITDLQSLVTGVQQHGCGLEAQLESWYRFLVQPDPWQSITATSDSPPKAQYQGVDATVLKMRHDFLRPDSVVAIIQISDEEDSWSDPLWLGGYGWLARTSATNDFGGPGQGAGPRGTSECDQPVDPSNPDFTGPNSPDCVSCAFQGNKPACPSNAPAGSCPNAGQPVSADPNCTSCAAGTLGCPKPGWYTPAQPATAIQAADGVNVRYSRQTMRSRYGFDNQHNYHRYVDGLQNVTVPDRDHESRGGGAGYEGDNSQYAPIRDCTNPLYAQNLPDGSDTSHNALCNLQPGARTPGMVFYTIIGGVPPDLLVDSNGNLKQDLSASDWTAILGKDPDHYIFDGIDPRMVQSTGPRCSGGSCAANMRPVSTTTYDNGLNGFREYNTLTSPAAIDLEYACVFTLPAEKDCNAPANAGACDCVGSATTDPGGTPLCDPTTRTTQKYGKAYPQSRYQLVAKALGAQGMVASICATDTNVADESLPSFGYNAALQGVIRRLKTALTGECLPTALPVTSGMVPCDVLVTYTAQMQTGAPGSFTDPPGSCTDPGMSVPAADILIRFDANYASATGTSQPPPVLCTYQQLTGPCEGSSTPGWCYAQSPNADGCAQAIQFGASGPPAGITLNLQCVN